MLIMAGTFGTAMVQWYLIWLFARVGGPVGVGSYSTLLALGTPTFLLGQLGLSDVYLTLTRHFPWRTYVQLRVAGMTAAALTLFALGTLSQMPPALTLGMIVFKVADGVFNLYSARIQRAEKLIRLGILSATSPAISFVLVTTVTLLTGRVELGVWSVALSSVISMTWAMRWAHRVPTPEPDSAAAGHRTILACSVPIAAFEALMAALAYVPVLLLGIWGTTAEVGIFAGASYLVVLANLIGGSLMTVTLPGFRRIAETDGIGAVVSRARRLGLWLSAVGLLGATIAVAFGPPVLEWVYGPEFRLDRIELIPLAIAAAITIPVYVLNSMLLIMNSYRSQFVIGAAATAAAVLSGVVLLSSGAPHLLSATLMAMIGVGTRVVLSLRIVSAHVRRAARA